MKLASRFNIPILIISAANALTAVALNSFVAQEYVSVLNAILSAGTGVLGSIQLYMKINEKMTNALRASILMKRLALKISKELNIEPENRVTDGQAFLCDCFSEFNTALEQGNPVEKPLENHLAFTPVPKKEKYTLMSLAAAVTGSPRKESFDGSSSSYGNLSRLGEPRAKKLWSLAETVQKASHFPRGSSSPFRPSGSSPEATTPEEPDVEIGAQGS
jgi:antitoxin component of MazEF toxin-antitoxin module